jgi:4-hydroxy 2-oxovalerate aldolase
MDKQARKMNFTIIDCTLRDGGYYNNWQFDKELAIAAIKALNRARIDIIEVGYKAPRSHISKTFEGLFRFCPESQLQFLKEYTQAQYSFMIDAKEFIQGGHADFSLLKGSLLPEKDSVFHWVRVATYFKTYNQAIELAKNLKDMGYKVTINLMGISLLSQSDVIRALKQTNHEDVDVFYFADSFGNLQSNDIIQYISLIREYFSGKIGIHTHDNQGLAFANTLTALEGGVDFFDATIMGMGRGSGNLNTEQFLLYSYFRLNEKKRNPKELLDVIDTYFAPLHQEYKWGWDYTYMLGALQNIHPSYCQSLKINKQYSLEQVTQIFNAVDTSKRSKYDETILLKAIDLAMNQIDSTEKTELLDLPLYHPVEGDTFLVIGAGPFANNYREEIITFIRQFNPVVIECHPKNLSFEKISQQYIVAILNWARLKNNLDEFPHMSRSIVTGLESVSASYANKANLFKIPCQISRGNLSIAKESFILPAYFVGMFAVSLALLSKPRTIYLAGFDGYENDSHPIHQEMNLFWKAIQEKLSSLISLTPTTYSLSTTPIFSIIQ